MECSNIATCLSFSALATEIKLEIFDHVWSASAQGSARLVSKEWNRLMRPRMWRNLATDFLSDCYEDIPTLPAQLKTCLYDIRSLIVGAKRTGQHQGERLVMLLEALHEDQLLEFECDTYTPVSIAQFFTLLDRQTGLRSLKVRLEMSTADIESLSTLAARVASASASSLRSLRQLCVYVGDKEIEGERARLLQRHEIEVSWALLQAVSNLDCLEICGWLWQGMPRKQRLPMISLFEHSSFTHTFPRVPNNLVLADMDLDGVEGLLVPALPLGNLHTLRLEFCDSVGPLLYALAAALRNEPHTSLHSLTVRTNYGGRTGENSGFRFAMHELLVSFEGLVNLECYNFEAAEIDWRLALARHSRLERLHVGSSLMGNGEPSWPRLVADMLESCPMLHYFAFSPTRPDLPLPEHCVPTSIGLPVRLYESLDIIANAHGLRTLRLLYAPKLRAQAENWIDKWADKAEQIAEHVATLVLSHLHRKGSNITRVAVYPDIKWTREHGGVHFFPRYFYRHRVANVDGIDTVTAMPTDDFVTKDWTFYA